MWSETGLEVVGEAEEGQQALRLARTLEPDAVLLDATLPGMTGAEVARALKRALPRVRVLALSGYIDEAVSTAMHAAGADAFLPKTCSAAELAARLQQLCARGPLGEEGQQVLTQFAQGRTLREIAAALGMSPARAEALKAEAMRALGLTNRAAVLRHARAQGWL
jgi:DNA-binding NarL/FixJ family response regulator